MELTLFSYIIGFGPGRHPHLCILLNMELPLGSPDPLGCSWEN